MLGLFETSTWCCTACIPGLQLHSCKKTPLLPHLCLPPVHLHLQRVKLHGIPRRNVNLYCWQTASSLRWFLLTWPKLYFHHRVYQAVRITWLHDCRLHRAKKMQLIQVEGCKWKDPRHCAIHWPPLFPRQFNMDKMWKKGLKMEVLGKYQLGLWVLCHTLVHVSAWS